jgi:hypothetical protein
MQCNASYTRFIFLESFHIYYNLICIFYMYSYLHKILFLKKMGVTMHKQVFPCTKNKIHMNHEGHRLPTLI